MKTTCTYFCDFFLFFSLLATKSLQKLFFRCFYFLFCFLMRSPVEKRLRGQANYKGNSQINTLHSKDAIY